MNGGRWNEEKKIQLQLKRAKNKEKKERARGWDDLEKNYGFSDTQHVTLCDICGLESNDVYRFRIESDLLRERVTGYPVRGVCPNCYQNYIERRTGMVSVGGDKPSMRVYDPKPRIKIF